MYLFTTYNKLCYTAYISIVIKKGGRKMEVGKRLKNIREKRKYSQYRLAQKSGISQSFLSSLEAGEKSPTINTLEKIGKNLSGPGD